MAYHLKEKLNRLLTLPDGAVIITTMKVPKGQATMTELLRRALLECKSLRAVERETGVIRQTMALFMSGKQSLRLDKADALAAYFGIRSHQTMQKGR
jgi:plasmid maintenance system antidote protein VapI